MEYKLINSSSKPRKWGVLLHAKIPLDVVPFIHHVFALQHKTPNMPMKHQASRFKLPRFQSYGTKATHDKHHIKFAQKSIKVSSNKYQNAKCTRHGVNLKNNKRFASIKRHKKWEIWKGLEASSIIKNHKVTF